MRTTIGAAECRELSSLNLSGSLTKQKKIEPQDLAARLNLSRILLAKKSAVLEMGQVGPEGARPDLHV